MYESLSRPSCEPSADHADLFYGDPLLNLLLDLQGVFAVAREVAELQELDRLTFVLGAIAVAPIWRGRLDVTDLFE